MTLWAESVGVSAVRCNGFAAVALSGGGHDIFGYPLRHRCAPALSHRADSEPAADRRREGPA
jgi:hypothetical protein